MKLRTKAIEELIQKQKAQLDKAIAKENAKIEKLHRQFSESIIQESVKDDGLKQVILKNSALKKQFEILADFYGDEIKTNKDNSKKSKGDKNEAE